VKRGLAEYAVSHHVNSASGGSFRLILADIAGAVAIA